MDRSWTGTPQERGYAFQDLMSELFTTHDIEYKPPFRGHGQELDGMFQFDAKGFLLEARWRKDEADFAALSHFHSKVETKLVGTVGIFVSMQGFSDGAIDSLKRMGECRLLLLPGIEFVKIIDQVISLPDALNQMVTEAHRHGVREVKLDV